MITAAILQLANEHLAVIAGIIGSASVILGVPFLRKLFLWPFIQLGRLIALPSKIIQILDEVRATRSELVILGSRFSRSEEHRKYAFWIQSRPAAEMDKAARVTQVSAQTLHLFKVFDEDELKGLSYQRFLDPKRVNDFTRAFVEVAANRSQFGFAIELRDSQRESLGVWELTAVPLGPEIEGQVTHVVNFVPVDDIAKGIAGRKRWVL